VQQVLGSGAGGCVDAGDEGTFCGRDERPVGGLPRGIRCGEVVQEGDIGREHRVQQARREQRGRCIPVDPQCAVEFVDLVVEPGLGGLGNAVDDVDPVAGQFDLGLAEHAGEHHRQQAGLGIAGAPGEQALDFDAAHGALIEIAHQLLLLCACAVAEAAAAGAADLERREVGEHAEQGGDLGMQRTAVADGEVEGEVVAARPGAEDLGIGRQQQV